MPIKPCFPSQVNQKDFEAKFTPQRAKALWDYAKAQPYFPKGYEAVIDGLYTDINQQLAAAGKQPMPREWIVKALARNKTVRKATAQMILERFNQDNILARARLEAKFVDSPRAFQAAQMVDAAIRGLYTLYHGAVFVWTHAASLAEMMVSDPAKALYLMAKGQPMDVLAGRTGYFLKMLTQSWANFVSKAKYADRVDWMESHPRYTWWAQRGADIKMGRGPVSIFGTREIKGSIRAWEGLKAGRLMFMDSELYDGDPRNPASMTLKPKYQGLTPAELEQVGSQIASSVNHVTGT